jgi:hypothetical protein
MLFVLRSIFNYTSFKYRCLMKKYNFITPTNVLDYRIENWSSPDYIMVL